MTYEHLSFFTCSSQLEVQTALLQKLVLQIQQIQDESSQRMSARVHTDDSSAAKKRVGEIEEFLEPYELDV